MRYITIPNTSLMVSQVCLGSGSFGSTIRMDEAFRLLDEFYAAGGNFMDSARIYAAWLPGGANASEKTLGAWQRSRRVRERVVLATKGAHPDLATMHISRLSPADITHDIEASLRCLQTDVIDLYWLHRDDPALPVGEILEALNDHVRAGHIRYFGCSNWRVARIRAAAQYAREHGLSGFVANQPMWSLAAPNREAFGDKTLVLMDDEDIAFHRESGMAVVPYSSQARGFFTKLADDRLKDGDRRRYDSPLNRARYECAQALAVRYDVPVTAIALSYLTSQPFPVIPIIGSKNLDQLRDSLRYVDLILSAEDAAALEGG